MPVSLVHRPGRTAAAVAAAAAAVTATALAAPGASAAPQSPQSVRSAQVEGAYLDYYVSGRRHSLVVGGTYTCTDPSGTMSIAWTGMQFSPSALASGSVTVPCGPGAVDAPWSAASLPGYDLHAGLVNVLAIVDGNVHLPPAQFHV